MPLNTTNKTSNKKTLVIVSHPYPEQSTFIKGLQQVAEGLQGITLRNLESHYGFDTRAINVNEENHLMQTHDRIVFMFPTHWFNITPMLKAYLNTVWSGGWPDIWKGKEMLVVTTAGGGSTIYGNSGRLGVELSDIFLPMKASALYCGMTYLPPLVFQAVKPNELSNYQQQLLSRLSE